MGAVEPTLERVRLRRFRDEQGRELFDRSVRSDPFERLDAATRRELAEEAERLAAFHA